MPRRRASIQRRFSSTWSTSRCNPVSAASIVWRPRAAAWRDTVIANDPYTRAFYTQLQRVVPLPQVPEWELIATDIASAAESAARGRQTIDAALTGLQRDVDQVLEKRRWMLARRRGTVASASEAP